MRVEIMLLESEVRKNNIETYSMQEKIKIRMNKIKHQNKMK